MYEIFFHHMYITKNVFHIISATSPSLYEPRNTCEVKVCVCRVLVWFVFVLLKMSWFLLLKQKKKSCLAIIPSINLTVFFQLLNNFFKDPFPEKFLVLFRNWVNDPDPAVCKLSLQKIASMAPVINEVCMCMWFVSASTQSYDLRFDITQYRYRQNTDYF